ncbi:hypothetical protein BX600DRAFT_481562 [Xylariales sp. PMI_506]|nr:hypothetical protein BX600DRAFT_481562 [Xylariales sp. PMI_506]
MWGTQWALIKSYGIASGTPLLVKTRQLCDPDKVGKRAEDTGVFLSEFLAGDIDNERGRLALSKLNWMHRQYQISDGDYIHTLCLFVLEPQRWIEKYEWRPMTYLEKVAHFLYWRELGARMGFGGIPETIEELAEWKSEYEKTHLYYIKENNMVTEATLNMFLRTTPKFLQGFLRSVFISFIEEKQVREAIGYPDPPAWATLLWTSFFRFRAIAMRHFILPRAKYIDPLAKPGSDGRLYRNPQFVAFEPWYVPNTWYNRLLIWWNTGGKMVPGAKYGSNGFLPEELGPRGFERISRDPVHKQAKAMEEYVQKGGFAGEGCPFAFSWKG